MRKVAFENSKGKKALLLPIYKWRATMTKTQIQTSACLIAELIKEHYYFPKNWTEISELIDFAEVYIGINESDDRYYFEHQIESLLR